MRMKGWKAVVFAAAIGLGALAGCGKAGGQQENGTAQTTTEEVISEAEASGSETKETASLETAEESYDGRLVSDGTMKLDYAETFSVELFKGGYRMLRIGDEARQYLVVPEGMDVPEDLDDAVTVLKLPLERVYMGSTGMVSLMNAIGALDCVSLVSTDVDGWYIGEVKAAMESGAIVYSGSYKEPDYEMMVEKNIQFYLDNAMIEACPEVTEKFTELGIPNMIEGSSKEKHPLARVEWVKLLGVLFGKEQEAQDYFDSQKALMELATAAESSGHTVAMGYITSSGKYYARNGGDYLVQMMELAGGDYVCAQVEPEKGGNTAMTFEEWYTAFKDADYFFYWNLGNKFYSIEEMIEYEPLFADFKSVGEGHVWITSPDFSQATSAISSIVSDMNAIFFSENPDEVTTDHLIKLPLK